MLTRGQFFSRAMKIQCVYCRGHYIDVKVNNSHLSIGIGAAVWLQGVVLLPPQATGFDITLFICHGGGGGGG